MTERKSNGKLIEPHGMEWHMDDMPDDLLGGVAASLEIARRKRLKQEPQDDTISRKRRKHTRPVSKGTGEPFFPYEEIEEIRQEGDKPVYLFGFLTAHDVDVKPEGKRHVAIAIEERLRQRNLHGIFFRDEKSKKVLFRSRDIREVVEAISNARYEIIPHVKGWPNPQVVARNT